MKHLWGKWRPCGYRGEQKGWAEENVQKLKDMGKKARLNSTTKPSKTPWGTITGKRWFAEYYIPVGAEAFRNGKWMKRIDKDGNYNLENLVELE